MKSMKKLAGMGLILALVMVLALAVPAMAAESYTITIEAPADENSKNTYDYEIYRLFDATYVEGSEPLAISYTPAKSISEEIFNSFLGGLFILENGYVKAAGDLDSATLQANKDKIESYAKTYGEKIGGTYTIPANGKREITVDKAGYYYISTTTGSLVRLDSYTETVTVRDKNEVPHLTKTVDDQIVQFGDDAVFTITITVGKGAVNYVLHDDMDDGLTFNNDISVSAKVSDGEDAAGYSMEEKWTKNTSTTDGCDFEISFDDSIPEGTVITVTYSAKVGDNLTAGAANKAKVTYGNPDPDNPPPETPEEEVKVYNAEFTIRKVDGAYEPLEGAAFVIRNDTEGEYQGFYYKNDNGAVSWVEDIDDATPLTPAEEVTVLDDSAYPDGYKALAITATGLDDGSYTLIETGVPAGYNKAGDVPFTIEKGDVAIGNLKQAATVVNQAGSELPDTGGVGTTIFTVCGGVLMVGAAILFITRKRSAKD